MSSKNTIYVVSLKLDQQKRRRLEQQFDDHNYSFSYIDAVDGKKISAGDYFEMVTPGLLKDGKLLSPTELGCALSHMAAMERFLESSSKYALVIEDDIIGNSASLDRTLETADLLEGEFIIICGGQEALPSRHYLLGNKTEIPKLYLVSKFSYKYLMRTCCYIATRGAAKSILAEQKTMMRLADSWGKFFTKRYIPIYFANNLKHPTDLSLSRIEEERSILAARGTNAFQQVIYDTVRAIRKLSRIIICGILMLLGKEKIPTSS